MSAKWLKSYIYNYKHDEPVLSKLCRSIDVPRTRLQMLLALGLEGENTVLEWYEAGSCACTVRCWSGVV